MALRHECDCRMSTLFNVFCGARATHVGLGADEQIKAARCEQHEKPANVQFPGLTWYRLGWDPLPQGCNDPARDA